MHTFLDRLKLESEKNFGRCWYTCRQQLAGGLDKALT